MGRHMPEEPDASDSRQWLCDAVASYEKPLVQYACRLVGDLHRARDVVQDTFLKLCDQDQADVKNLPAWLYTVCRNRATDVMRKERRMSSFDTTNAAPIPAAGDGPYQAVELEETQRRALEALDALPPPQQEVIRLKFQQELSYRQIAEVTQQTPSNVGYLIHAGLKTLRQRLAKA